MARLNFLLKKRAGEGHTGHLIQIEGGGGMIGLKGGTQKTKARESQKLIQFNGICL